MLKNDDDALVRALIKLQHRDEDERLRKLCARLGIQYVERNDVVQRNFMLADIGIFLAKTQPEFAQKKRGGQRKAVEETKPVRLAQDVENLRVALQNDGYDFTDTEIATFLHEEQEFSVSTKYDELRSVLQQVSRGKTQLAKMRARFTDVMFAKKSAE